MDVLELLYDKSFVTLRTDKKEFMSGCKVGSDIYQKIMASGIIMHTYWLLTIKSFLYGTRVTSSVPTLNETVIYIF